MTDASTAVSREVKPKDVKIIQNLQSVVKTSPSIGPSAFSETMVGLPAAASGSDFFACNSHTAVFGLIDCFETVSSSFSDDAGVAATLELEYAIAGTG